MTEPLNIKIEGGPLVTHNFKIYIEGVDVTRHVRDVTFRAGVHNKAIECDIKFVFVRLDADFQAAIDAGILTINNVSEVTSALELARARDAAERLENP